MRAVAPQLQPEDEFAAAREQFAQMEAFLVSDEAHSKTHSELERELEKQGRELLRRLYQAHLELRAPGEATAAVRDSQGQVREQSRRQNGGWKRSLERFGWSGSAMGERAAEPAPFGCGSEPAAGVVLAPGAAAGGGGSRRGVV